jgi:tetratricopeptide (TPR) repeat protein
MWSSADGGNLTAAPLLMNLFESRSSGREGDAIQLAREARRLRKLLAESPAAYTPVVDLYTRAHALAVGFRKTRTATHLEIETLRLIDESMAARQDEEGAKLGSLFLTRLALTSRDGQDLDSARRLFDRALEIDPFNEVALHAAAAIREKLGNYAEAADLLQRLLLLDDLPDAELRLALCLERMGRSKRAERRLEQLARGNADRWIRSIAYQEWSQIRSSRDETDAALTLAREGHAALPDDDSLAILVAFLSGSRDELSSALVLRLTSTPTGEGPTARGIYNLWPAGVSANEAAIREEAEFVIPVLRNLLAGEYGSGSTPAPRPSRRRALR